MNIKKLIMITVEENFIFPHISILKVFSQKNSISSIKKIKSNIEKFHKNKNISNDEDEDEDEDKISYVGEEINIKTNKYTENEKDLDEFILAFKKQNGELHEIGIRAFMSKVIEYNQKTYAALIVAQERVIIMNATTDKATLIKYAEYKPFVTDYSGNDIEEKQEMLLDLFLNEYITDINIPSKILKSLKEETNPEIIIDIIAKYANLTKDEQYKIITDKSLSIRMNIVLKSITNNIEINKTKKKIKKSIKKNVEGEQKNFFLREQLKVIQKELGDDDFQEMENLESKIKAMHADKNIQEKLLNELSKLKKMNSISAEAGVIRNYLECVLSLPWNKTQKTKQDIKVAEQILNDEHYGLEDVKERILEYIAVYNRIGQEKSTKTILCLIGPPGVGKTSLASSIANALKRPFVKVSLGGVFDESDIRGHRRTYVGAMPGRIMEAMKTAKVNNPVILLDEIDKLGQGDGRSNPSSALLEVLDPEQNANFRDHYIDINYNLSRVIFIATANTLKMQSPLLSRMEIINLSGYTVKEKMIIAKNHIIPDICKSHELKNINLSDEVLQEIIEKYTQEAGVRSLERKIATIARKIIKNNMTDINLENIEKFLGIKKIENQIPNQEHKIGFVNGLAYTDFGGEVLSCECRGYTDKGTISITGNTGKVMNESVHVAMTYIKSELKNLIKNLYINPIEICDFYDIDYKQHKYIKYLSALSEKIIDSKVLAANDFNSLKKISQKNTFDLNAKINKKAIASLIDFVKRANYELFKNNHYEYATIKSDEKIKLINKLLYENAIFSTFIVEINEKITAKINKMNFHLHMPEGAIPKDGPSAGVCMISLISSVILNKKIRGDISMTGEVSLSGNVMAIGGLKEKMLASLQSKIKNVIIPYQNKNSIKKINKSNSDILKDINIIKIKTIHDLLLIVFCDNEKI